MTYFILGLLIGGVGALVGVGGGFLLVPLLLVWQKDLSSAQVTAISLFCVSVNAFSGSIQYTMSKLIHFRAGLLFALASLPGAWIAAGATHMVAREKFEIVYAILLCFLAAYLLKRPKKGGDSHDSIPRLQQKDYITGTVVSFFVGFMASFFGVGGGIVHVPFLHKTLRFPVRMATGTSIFILLITSLSATLHHYMKGSLELSQPYIFLIAAGMFVGAQFGGRLSKKVSAELILKILAAVILLVAFKILYFAFIHPLF